VRRFRKDVIADLRNSVKERDSADVECAASEREERVFALLKELKLPDSDGKAKAGQLFKTTLAKSLLSSPMAALETVRNRLKRLEATTSTAGSPASADRAALQSLEPLLAAITPADFSKYQRLLQLIRADWSWSGKDPSDRIVLFTGRRETQRFLVEHLAADLDLPKGAVVGLDGAMPDVEQTRVVEQFAPEKVILFGSLARGEARWDSDADILVVMPFEGSSFERRLEMLEAGNPSFPVDLLLCRPEAAQQRYRWGDPFIREAFDHGEVLHG
jgi:hypothetical protein